MTIASKKRPRTRRRISLFVELMEARSLLASMAVINWSIAPQIAPDPAHGNAPDLPNTPAYVNPPGGYEVLLDASASTGITPRSTFTWTITPSTGAPIVVSGEAPDVDLPEGTYSVRLEADGLRGTRGPVFATSPVVVKDVLIVSIGDSYASGEGNPVVPGYYGLKAPEWAYSPDPAMEQENADAHRSTIAGPAQFALQLQESNPQEAVTFVSVADSGASIPVGLLGPMTSAGDPNVTLPAELAEVAQIVGSHPIDVLTVSIGGNDIGFSTRIEQLVTNTLVGLPTLDAIKSQVDASIGTLPSEYAMLGQAIQALNPGKVLITEYPDPTRDDQGNFAPITLGGIPIISRADDQFAAENILNPFDRAVHAAAIANGWTFVDGLVADFRTHGYPSSDPWINDLGTSFRVEGTDQGAFHPNAAGHQDIAANLLATFERSDQPVTPGVVHIQSLARRVAPAHRTLHPMAAAHHKS